LIRSVGIDLSRTGSHQVRCLDEQARPCDSFSFDSTLEGLETPERARHLQLLNLQYLLGHSDLIMVRHYTLALGMDDTLRAHQKASLQTYYVSDSILRNELLFTCCHLQKASLAVGEACACGILSAYAALYPR
jgi:hypothetical protein